MVAISREKARDELIYAVADHYEKFEMRLRCSSSFCFFFLAIDTVMRDNQRTATYTLLYGDNVSLFDNRPE